MREVEPRPVLVLGAGGNCRDIVDAMLDANRHAGRPLFEPLGYLDDDPAKRGRKLAGVEVLGPLSQASSRPDCWFVDGLNGTELTRRKAGILARLGIPRDRFATVVHPSASVSRFARLGAGTVLLQNVSVCSEAVIGDHVMVLPNSVVSHDGTVGDGCYLTPGVVLAGYVRLGAGVYMGARSAVTCRVTIGDGAIVGLGSVVLADVAAGAVVAGVPARPLGRRDSSAGLAPAEGDPRTSLGQD